MRNLRKVVALVLAFAMVLSMGAVSFAADMTAAETATALEILQGEGEGVTAEYLAKTPTRLQAAIMSLRLQGLEDEALAFEGTDSFTDADDVAWAGGKAILAYLKATPAAGWGGYPDGSFKPNDAIGAQAYVKVMLEALGYEQDVDFTWAEVFTFAASVGLDDITADTVMTNNELAVGSVEALGAMTKDGEKLVDVLVAAGKIDETVAQETGLVEAPAAAFAVDTVEPWGLNGLMITFTSDIDGDVTLSVGTAAIVEDGAVAYVLLDGEEAQATEVTVKITAKGKDGVELKDVEKKVTMTDISFPEMVGVTVTNAKTIVVEYSEPIETITTGTKVFDDVKIGDAKLVGTATLNATRNEVTYALNSVLAADSYVFTTEKAYDYAGFVAPAKAETITVVADNTAPALVSATAKDLDTIELVFDEAVTSISSVVVGNYDVDATYVYAGTKVTINLANGDEMVASDHFVPVACSYKNATDVMGNKSGDTAIEFTVAAPFDQDVPTATVEVLADNMILVTYSEAVTGAGVDGAYKLTDDDNKDAAVGYSVVAALAANSTKLTADVTNGFLVVPDTLAVDKGNYTLTIGNADVVDGSVLMNKVAKTTVPVVMNDLNVPTVSGNMVIVTTTADAEVGRISFSEAMDTALLADVNNYLYEDAPLKQVTGYAITVAADGKSVDIKIPGLASGHTVNGYGLTDVAGNALSAADITVADRDNFVIQTAVQKSANTIEITANSAFEIADANEFEIWENGTKHWTVYVVNAVVDADAPTKVTLTLSENIKPDATTGNAAAAVLDVKVASATDTVNVFGKAVSDITIGLTETVAATASVKGGDDMITITFDEVLTATQANCLADIIVKDANGAPLTLIAGDFAVDNAKATDSGLVTEVVITNAAITDADFSVEIFSRYLTDGTTAINALSATTVTVE